MKLRMISEIQHKLPTTNMDRSNVTGSYAVASINDYLHMVHDGDGHAKTQNKNKIKRKKQDKQ